MKIDLLPGIDHYILLMFENRSFDNILGGFYPSESEAGGVPPQWSNPLGSGKVGVWQANVGSAAQNIPYPDPNETFLAMSAQINDPGPMLGFAENYNTVERPAVARDIMQYYLEGNVPVTHALAKFYSISDRYFASGPVQTWPNRLFSLCGTPGYRADGGENRAYLNNKEYPEYPLMWGQLDWPNIFQLLESNGESWRIYYHGTRPIAVLIKTAYEQWTNDPSTNRVWGFEERFFKDVDTGNLPTLTLIEPRYQDLSEDGFVPPTSNHPGSSSAILKDDGSPINISCGERFLGRIYNALANNPELFERTLLIVTYDEHGGLFDHVYPPPAPSPFPEAANIQGFKYDQYGVRVPTLFINPRVSSPLFRPPGGVKGAFDHTSLLRTLVEKYSPHTPHALGPRVNSAPTFDGLIDPHKKPEILPPVQLPKCEWDGLNADSHSWPFIASALAESKRNRGG